MQQRGWPPAVVSCAHPEGRRLHGGAASPTSPHKAAWSLEIETGGGAASSTRDSPTHPPFVRSLPPRVALDPESDDVAVDSEKTLHMYPFLSELKKMYFGWLLKRSWQLHFLPLYRLAGVWSLHQFFIQTSHILPACSLLLLQIALQGSYFYLYLSY